MQQTEQVSGFNESGLAASGLVETGLAIAGRIESGVNEAGAVMVERKRVESVVETLTHLRGEGESLEEVAHDARNMVTALGIYCDLLEEPGVLTPSFLHYANELRLVATASRRLVEKLLALDVRLGPVAALSRSTGSSSVRVANDLLGAGRLERARRWDLMPAEPIDNLAAELAANRNLLAALAGPAIVLTVDTAAGALPVRLTSEDLTRILVNLVKNAAEAMPEGGSIQLVLSECPAVEDAPKALALTVEDNGPGIPENALDKVFDSGYTTRASGAVNSSGSGHGNWVASHRGLGLSITRSIVEGAGGSIHAAHRIPSGACFTIELPVRTR
ncbi:MAG: sensor histidine kinase [Terracidiphilus sp.]